MLFRSVPVDLLSHCLPRVLSELSPEDREAIVFCDIQGVTQRAFAERLGLSLPAAKSRVQRARQLARQFRSYLRGKADEAVADPEHPRWLGGLLAFAYPDRIARQRRAVQQSKRRRAAHIYHGSIILRYLLGRRVFGERMQGL